MNIIKVLSRYHLKLPNDFKEMRIMAVVKPKPPQTLLEPPIVIVLIFLETEGSLGLRSKVKLHFHLFAFTTKS
jgi:hypothetical protein